MEFQDADIGVAEVLLLLSMGTLCAVSVLANGLVILTIVLTKRLRCVSSALVVTQALFDLGLGLLANPLAIRGVVLQSWPDSQGACEASAALFTFFSVGSVQSMGAIALDRFLTIVFCLRYSAWSPWRYVGLLLLWMGGQALAFALTPLVDWGRARYENASFLCMVSWSGWTSYAVTFTLLCHGLPFFILVISYVSIVRIARRHARRICDVNASVNKSQSGVEGTMTQGAVAAGAIFSIRRLSVISFPETAPDKSDRERGFLDPDLPSLTSSSPVHSSHGRRDVTAAARLLALVVAYVICWLPFLYVRLTTLTRGDVTDSGGRVVATVAMWLCLGSGALNPFLYAIVSKRFRQAVQSLFTCSNNGHGVTSDVHPPVLHVTSYDCFLQNLRSPSPTPLESTALPDVEVTGSCEVASRTSSAGSTSPRHSRHSGPFLAVPRGAEPRPNSAHKALASVQDKLRAREAALACARGGGRGVTDPVRIQATPGDYVFSANNKASIQITLELV